MLKFDNAIALFKTDRIRDLSSTEDGMRFLKLRSLSRKEYLEHIIMRCNLEVGETKARDWLKLLYESDIQVEVIDDIILEIYENDSAERRANEHVLINELYRVQSFDWGGLHQNSLEKTIVNNYVKKIISYDKLCSTIENDIHNSMRAYVLASWYNHWTSIIIEDIFKAHSIVVPAIGRIRKIDFFVLDKPFDLKVTYLPEGYIKYRRKLHGLKPEITLMKKLARELKVPYNRMAPESVLIPDLWKKLDDNPNQIAEKLIEELQNHRESIVNLCIENPENLIRWLYENQGARRFDASNRLFLVLVDKSNFFESWKLKRAKDLIENRVHTHLTKLDSKIGFPLDFDWEGESYTTESDAIFVVKNKSKT